MKYFAKKAYLLLLFAALLFLTGCRSDTIDRYFSLPKPEKEYLQLQELIDKEISSGCEYAAPTGGVNRRSVQLVDLNADGEEEALVFYREENQSLKVVIYSRETGNFAETATLRGDGTSVAAVDYADMNFDGLPDILISWKTSSAINRLEVVSLENEECRTLLQSDCNEFIVTDMNKDERNDLLLLRRTATDAWYADLYTFYEDSAPQASTAALSKGISKLQSFSAETLYGDWPVLLVESLLDNGSAATDLMICRDGALYNLTANLSSGVSEITRNFTAVSARDIDADGYLEVPKTQQLYSQDGNIFYSVTWYRYDATGRASVACNTYHCPEDGWYFILPADWETGLTVRRSESLSGENAVTLSSVGTDGNINDLVTIFTLTGENRKDRARISGRFRLAESESAIYMAQLHNSGYSEKTIETNFRILYSEWTSGSFDA